MMNKGELLQIYGLLFENWRFQINSNWQRTNYFAVFEIAALGGVWKIISERYIVSGFVAASLGFLLTIIWFLNDIKAGKYIDYWWQSLSRIEKDIASSGAQGEGPRLPALDFVSNYFHNCEIYKIERLGWPRYQTLMRAVPKIFMLAWFCCWLFALSYCRCRHPW
jgi:hypothetical protein